MAGRDAPPADEDDVAGEDAHQQGASTPPALARLGMEVNPRVFFPSATAILVFVAFGAFASETAEEWFTAAEQAVATGLNWWYIVLVTGLLGFVVWLGLSRHGRLRLGAAPRRAARDAVRSPARRRTPVPGSVAAADGSRGR